MKSNPSDNLQMNYEKLVEIHNDIMEVLEKHNVYLEVCVDEDDPEDISVDVVEHGSTYWIGYYCSEFHDIHPSSRSRKK